jgi:hypothetical protein
MNRIAAPLRSGQCNRSAERQHLNPGGSLAISTAAGFSGRLDEVAIFDTAMTAPQLQQLIEFGAIGVVQ